MHDDYRETEDPTDEEQIKFFREARDNLREAIITATGSSGLATDADLIGALADWSKTLDGYRAGEKPLQLAARKYILATNEGLDTTAAFLALVSEATRDLR